MNDQAVVDLDNIHLAFGPHHSREDGMCLLEAVAYVAGEPHTDRPRCACPVLAAFGRAWNDALSDEDRNRLLKPFIRRLIGTRSTPEVEQRRAFLATDWAVRTCTPMWLRAAGLDDEAASLEALAPLTSAEACLDAAPRTAQVREAALAAAWATTRDAPWAARTAAEAAGVLAAVAAARAAAGYAAVAAARRASVYAARAALAAARVVPAGADATAVATAVLRPHVERLQASALDLFERMIEVRP